MCVCVGEVGNLGKIKLKCVSKILSGNSHNIWSFFLLILIRWSWSNCWFASISKKMFPHWVNFEDPWNFNIRCVPISKRAHVCYGVNLLGKHKRADVLVWRGRCIPLGHPALCLHWPCVMRRGTVDRLQLFPWQKNKKMRQNRSPGPKVRKNFTAIKYIPNDLEIWLILERRRK